MQHEDTDMLPEDERNVILDNLSLVQTSETQQQPPPKSLLDNDISTVHTNNSTERTRAQKENDAQTHISSISNMNTTEHMTSVQSSTQGPSTTNVPVQTSMTMDQDNMSGIKSNRSISSKTS